MDQTVPIAEHRQEVSPKDKDDIISPEIRQPVAPINTSDQSVIGDQHTDQHGDKIKNPNKDKIPASRDGQHDNQYAGQYNGRNDQSSNNNEAKGCDDHHEDRLKHHDHRHYPKGDDNLAYITDTEPPPKYCDLRTNTSQDSTSGNVYTPPLVGQAPPSGATNQEEILLQDLTYTNPMWCKIPRSKSQANTSMAQPAYVAPPQTTTYMAQPAYVAPHQMSTSTAQHVYVAPPQTNIYTTQPAYVPPLIQEPAQHVPDYVCLSVGVLLCCCLPFGIIGLVFSINANRMRGEKKYQAAKQAASKARTFNIIGIVLGIIFTIFYILSGILRL
ncbi:uncharacterized protein LOC131942798 [Physella acuta]|uniref:uncharacterized protein LOC131942798 n=1 Tax=Physella acuta TaxID=109671 RepID=UPI0027DC6F3A|nr:uncharacterized protein LOC131942798 [Physella acuta]